MSQNKLCVCLYDKPVGLLELDRNQKMTFSYQKDATHAISLSMPLKDKTFDDLNCRKFFRGLLPENSQLLELMSHDAHCLVKDTFGLLHHYGKESNGALSFWDLRDVPIDPSKPFLQMHNTTQTPFDVKLQKCFGLFSGNEKKFQVKIVEQKMMASEPGKGSTHFLKMSNHNKILNEYFCLNLAKDLGIDCVNVSLQPVAKELGLLVERYDRKMNTLHQMQFCHQEDFAQALGHFAIHKYEWDKGPNLKECFGLLTKAFVPAICRLQLVRRVLFNYFIGNVSAHAKNMSLLYLGMNKPMLAPLYSVMGTCDDTQTMAMKIGNSYQIAQISMNDWKLFCKETKYSFPILKQMLREYAEQIVPLALKHRDRMKAQKRDVNEIDKLIIAVKLRCERVEKQQ